MTLENVLEFPHKEKSLEQKVQVGLKDIVKQLNWKDYLIMGGTTVGSVLTAGIGLTAAFIFGNLLVYKGLMHFKADKPITKKGFLAEYIFANIMAPGYNLGYNIFLGIANIYKRIATGLTLMVPLSYAFYFVTKNALHNYTFKEFVTGIFNGTFYKDSYNVLQNNLWRAYKKTLIWAGPPLIAFWTLVPEPLQKILHATLGIASRLGLKAFVDKDVGEVFKKDEPEKPPDRSNVFYMDDYKKKKEAVVTPNGVYAPQYDNSMAA